MHIKTLLLSVPPAPTGPCHKLPQQTVETKSTVHKPWGFLIIPAVQTEETQHTLLAWKLWYFVAVSGTSVSNGRIWYSNQIKMHFKTLLLSVYSPTQLVLATKHHSRLRRHKSTVHKLLGFLIIPAVQTEETQHPLLTWKLRYFVAVSGTSVSCTNIRNTCTQR